MNAKRCIAFLTQTKTFIPDEFRDKIGNRLYGCDTCQVVCPKNKGKDFHLHPEMEPDPEVVKPLLKPLLHMTNRQFKETFGHLSGAWRGKKPIQRNAIIALAHYKDESAIDDLLVLLQEDSRPVIRGTGAWALGKIGKREVATMLQQAKERERDEDVIREIEKALAMLENV